jgi:putative transposase
VCRAPTSEQFRKPVSGSVPTIVRLFKSAVTKHINNIRPKKYVPVWQRNYYEHIIHENEELNRVWEYIIQNPAKWEDDEYNLK